MRHMKYRHSGRFVNAARLHAYETILNQIDATDAVGAADLIKV